MHVSPLIALMLMVLVIHLILLSRNCLSALLMISQLLWIVMLFLSFKLTGVIPTLGHHRVTILWLSELAIFFARPSHSNKSGTHSFLNLWYTCWCRFLILLSIQYNTSGYHISVDNFFSGQEMHNITRTIKKAMYISVNYPSLNKNTRRFHLPNIWDEVLINTPALHLK